eukprot:3507800-Pyramimonas_sp.AAC.1
MPLVHASFGPMVAFEVVIVVVVAAGLAPIFHEDEVADANIRAPVSLRQLSCDGPGRRPSARRRDKPILVLL